MPLCPTRAHTYPHTFGTRAFDGIREEAYGISMNQVGTILTGLIHLVLRQKVKVPLEISPR